MLDTIILLDHHALQQVNQFVGVSQRFDGAVRLLANNTILKGMVPMMLIWSLWFHRGGDTRAVREKLTATAILSVLAILLGRASSNFLPFRDRPIHTANLDVNLAEGLPANVLNDWSSFPSDHAMLYFALATGIVMVSRRLGLIACVHAAVFVCLPRIYLGLHFPGDILAGALIGVVATLLLMGPLVRLVRRWRLPAWEAHWPQVFYPAMFFVSFQIASMFDSLRNLARFVF